VAREYQEHDGTVDGNTLFVQYDYEDGAAGGVAKYVRLEEVTYPNGREVQYGYGTTGAIDDIMSRLATIGDGTNTYAAYKYLGAGRIVTEDYEEIEVKLDHAANDLAALDRFGRVLDQIWADYGDDPLDAYTYTYDRAGNRTSRNNELHSAFDEDYTYNGLDELISSSRADDFDQSWTLDGLGNFSAFDDDGTTQTRTANGANEITAITGGWITPAYDAAGNMTSGPTPGDGETRIHYVYDAWNRLVGVKADDSGEPGDTLATYGYDGTNRRIEKIVTEGADNHYYYNHQWQLLEQRQSPIANPQSLTSYVWSPRYVDSPVVRFHDANGDGDLLDVGDNTRYYTTDANHNVTATIDAATGDVVERYVYTPYGTATVYDDDWANPVAPTTDGPLYCGYFFDAETGLYQVRNRYYDASLSRFISRDPIGFAAGDMNLYRYVRNEPTGGTDASGLESPGAMVASGAFPWFPELGWHIYDREGVWPVCEVLPPAEVDKCGYGCGGVAAWRAGCDPQGTDRYYPGDILKIDGAKVYKTWREAVEALKALGAEGGLIIAMQWKYAHRDPRCLPDNWATFLGRDPRSGYWECVNHGWAGSPGKHLATAKITHQLGLPGRFQDVQYVVVPGRYTRCRSPVPLLGPK
jgi:RHS repeat-associated protein